MPGLMIILDGLQDTAYDMTDGKTPYDYGKRDNFREFETASSTGLLLSTPEGFEPDTQNCILYMLGVPAGEIPEGRSCIEALAQGIEVGYDDLIMRCNFVRVSDDGKLEIPCCAAPPEIAEALREEVSSLPGVSVYPVGSYKSLQLVRGKRSAIEGLVTSMPHQNQGEIFEDLLPRGNPFADGLADFSRRMLEKYRPYTVLNWAQSVERKLPAFAQLHSGMTGGIVSKTDCVVGVGLAMGMKAPAVPTATGDTDTDIPAKLAATLELLRENDFTMLHIGGTDEATHRQDPREKADFIAKLDRELLGPVMRGVKSGTRIMLTCDHEALCSTAGHTASPVRYWLWEKGKTLSGDMGISQGIKAVDILFK